MTKNFTGKNVLITGGSSGIGLAVARLFTEAGSKVWLLARDESKLLAASESLGLKNDRNYFVADVSKFTDFEDVLHYFKSHDIQLDFLINSAGVTQPGEFESMDMDKFHWMMDINFFGTVNTIKALFPLIKKGSTIVNISSMAAILGIYGYSAYSASKFAVRGFSDTLRSELKLAGIHVAIVYPPDTETPQLEYDNRFKPKITKELSASAGIMSAEKVASEILNGIARHKYVIIPGLESKIIYLATNIFGRRTYNVVDWMISSAIKKIKQHPE